MTVAESKDEDEPTEQADGQAEHAAAPRRYRVWDGEEMHEPPHEYVRDAQGNVYQVMCGRTSLTDYNTLDYTGKDDAEGTPIYEGDVLLDDTVFQVRGLVRWHDATASWIVETDEGWDYLHAWVRVGATVVANLPRNLKRIRGAA